MFRITKRPRMLIALAILSGGSAIAFAGVVTHPGDTMEPATRSATVFSTPPMTRSFADVVQQVSPSVVNINVVKDASATPTSAFAHGGFGGDQQPFDDFFQRFFGMPGGPQQNRRLQAEGSGFIIDQAGFVVTNNHVIDGASEITVIGQDGVDHPATLVGSDATTDLALLKIDAGTNLPALSFGDSDQARVGDWVLAIGNPFGLGGTATAGIISARGRDIRSGPYDDFLQIDAPINSGNSGGPVFNADGEVIGVNTAIYSPNGGSVGIGFAIPSSQVVAVVDQLKAEGSVRRGWLGVQIQDLDEDMSASFGLEKATGAVVADVVPDSPAARAGVEVGDIVQQFDGQDIADAKALGRVVAATDPEKKVTVKVWRDGHGKTIRVKLENGDSDTQAANVPSSKTAANGELGIRFANLSDEYRHRLGLPDDYRGVVITDVRPDSSAAEQGLRPGDVVSRIDTQEVNDLRDVTRAVEDAKKHGDHATLLVRRGDGQQFISVAMS